MISTDSPPLLLCPREIPQPFQHESESVVEHPIIAPSVQRFAVNID